MSSGSKPQSCAPLSHGTSVTKHKFHDEMTETFKMVTTEHQPPYVGQCLCASEVGCPLALVSFPGVIEPEGKKRGASELMTAGAGVLLVLSSASFLLL